MRATYYKTNYGRLIRVIHTFVEELNTCGWGQTLINRQVRDDEDFEDCVEITHQEYYRQKVRVLAGELNQAVLMLHAENV